MPGPTSMGPTSRHWSTPWPGWPTSWPPPSKLAMAMKWSHRSGAMRPVPGPPTTGTGCTCGSRNGPVYRPSIWYFRECVRSVMAQTYENWQLCLCDDGSDEPLLTRAMAELAESDPRIVVVALEENGGISRATNRALDEAVGEFVVLLDHDDVLEPSALAELAAAVVGTDDVDVVYSDEDKLDELGRRFQPHFKPDWDPELLLAYPYICLLYTSPS